MMRAGRTTTLRAALLGAAITLCATSAAAQTVGGRVVEADGAPIATALVTLVDARGVAIRAGISGADGAFSLAAPSPGRYTLRVERIGFEPHVTAPFELDAAGRGGMIITVVAAPVRLAAVRAQGSRRCVVQPRDGSALATLWAEARKGLELAALLEQGEDLLLEGVSYTRQLDHRAREQRQVLHRLDFVTRALPYRAASGETLARAGFALVDRDGSHVYFAPTALTLLSDEFLERHCFHRIVADRAEPGRIGLGFTPIRGETTVGISGTFWLDRESANVLAIEFDYLDPARRLPRGGSGRVELARLANGLPHIARWWIRMPEAQLTPVGGGRTIVEIAAILETGGVVLRVDGTELGDPHGIVAALDAARADDAAAGAILHEDELAAIGAYDGSLHDALNRFGTLLRVGEGVFNVPDGSAERMLCVEAGPAGVMPYELRPRVGDAPVCTMIDVYLAGERVARPGAFLLQAKAADFASIELLPPRRAVERLGPDVRGDVLLLTPRRRD